MDSMLSTLAFSALIGAQFLAAIVLISRRRAIYGVADEAKTQQDHGARNEPQPRR